VAANRDELLFELGDIARDRLANRPARPRAMDRVFKAEDMLVQRREEIEQLEARMNETDEAFEQFVDDLESEKASLQPVVARFQKLVDAVDAKAKDARKRLAKKRLSLRAFRLDVESLEKRQEVLDRSSPEAAAAGRERLKKVRLALLREQREIEELEREIDTILAPQEGSPGERALLAHRRILSMDDELASKQAEKAQTLAALDAAVVQKEDEVRAAEELLERALRALGEEVYAMRIADPALTPLYPKLDKAR
jgi:chromosome segregation ATPase